MDIGKTRSKEVYSGRFDVDDLISNFTKIREFSDDSLDVLNKILDLYEMKISYEVKLGKLYKDYLKGFMGYVAYNKSLKAFLGDKSEEELFSEIKHNIKGLLEKLVAMNSFIFQGIYSYEPKINVKSYELKKKALPSIEKPTFSVVRLLDKRQDKSAPKETQKTDEKPIVTGSIKRFEKVQKKIPDIPAPGMPAPLPEKKTFRVTPEKIEQIRKLKKDSGDIWDENPDDFLKLKSIPKPVPNQSISDIVGKFGEKKDSVFTDDSKAGKKRKNHVFIEAIGSFFRTKKKSIFDKNRKNMKKDTLIDNFIRKKKKDESVLSQKTVLSERFKNIRKIRYDANQEKELNLGMMSEQIGNDVFRNKRGSSDIPAMTYYASSYGSLANILVKDASLELINSFPDVFKQLYRSIRLANLSVLSSTYTNMMVFSSIICFAGTSLVAFIISLAVGASALPSLLNSLFFGILGAVAVIAGYMYYPHYRIKKREQDIKTNLPFAIDHMSAVVSSGVAPTSMFKLIVQSKEYGEISKEIEKVVEYVDLFGYDIITAIDTVALLSPSQDLKEFFEGFISTVESGGDLKKYLREKADAMMVQYKLERQKYTEVISTFSDVYTGIMVASPLFFVAALSLISVLGGGIGGVDVNVIVVVGTYIFIPLLNIIFMAFIEATQPNI
ncbi:MAG: type II secretion system F family protein [Candidatus Woesearchaeota archaeon]